MFKPNTAPELVISHISPIFGRSDNMFAGDVEVDFYVEANGVRDGFTTDRIAIPIGLDKNDIASHVQAELERKHAWLLK